jgi:2-oxoglutarate ferredoxin oxidoreductase subunit alpha
MAEKVLMKGNEAIAEAALRAGCRAFFGYPITPQTELAAYMARRMPKENGVYVQAESEIGAINMVYGAAGAGARCMTSTSSPGMSLKTEGLSYIAGANLPAVIVNVQRGGPGLGGIQPSQSDYWQATRAAGHGDFHPIVIAPSTVQEMASTVNDAFDLAETYLTPVIVLIDGMLGQMMEPVQLPEEKSHTQDKPWAVTGHGNKRKQNVINSLHLDPAVLERTNFERFERYETIKKNEQRVESYCADDADIVIVAFGACARVSRTAVDKAREAGIKAGLIRPITLVPFTTDAIEAAIPHTKTFLAVEMNMGQMVEDVRLVVQGRVPVEFFGRTGGIIPTPNEVLEHIKEIDQRKGGDAQ